MQEKERMEQEHGAKMWMAECWMVVSAAMLSFLILSCQSSMRRIRQLEAGLEAARTEAARTEAAVAEMRLDAMEARLGEAIARTEAMERRVEQTCLPLPPAPRRWRIRQVSMEPVLPAVRSSPAPTGVR